LNILFFSAIHPVHPESSAKIAHTTEFVLATALFQANSCLQDERLCAAVISAAERLNDGVTQTSQIAVALLGG